MPSFLSRLLGRKKTQESDSSPDKPGYPSLLEGKFEAVSPNVSPSAALFTDPVVAHIRGNDKPKDRESPFYLFRPRSRPSSDFPTAEKAVPDVPHLSLNLSLTKDRARALDVLFESDPEAFARSHDAAIGERRLTPHQALSLVRACSQVIMERGLETLGVMHPHWHSACPEVQQRLISLYLLSLASNSSDATAPPTSPVATAAFESELHYARSPHDVAAVLRWSLRHLKLDGVSFGNESGDWTWYNTFTEAERTDSYPPDAFSKSLIPQLPPAHAELLLATLDIISSLAAHCEANGSSGSKLSKFFGLWLLTSEHSTEGQDWSAFYERWDRAGRILEHLFLARIRDGGHRMPRRLTELVEHYPYDPVDALEDNLLPRPRFSTRLYDALFVQLDTEYTGALKPKSHPLRLIADALRAQCTAESATPDDADLWDAIKKASLTLDAPECASDTALTEPIPVFSNIFSDETIRLFSLIPVDTSDKDKSAPSFALQSPISPRGSRAAPLLESPLSPVQIEQTQASSSSHAYVVPSLTANLTTAPTTASPETPADWLQFSNQGFGTMPSTRDLVAKLWDNDVEVTVPPPIPLSPKSSRRARSRGSSVDSPSVQTHVSPLPALPEPPVTKTTLITKVKLDEAFIDFWADSLLDPVSKRWPRFVLCQLKPLPSAVASTTTTLAWLVIEQRFVHIAPPPPPQEEAEVTTPLPRPRPRASSPRRESSRFSAAFSLASKKRFGFFTGGSGDPKSPKEKAPPLPLVGELGEAVKGMGDDAVAAEVEKSKEEARAQDGADGGLASAATAVVAAAVVAAGTPAATAGTAQEEIMPAPAKDGLPEGTVPSEPAAVTAVVKDSHTPADISQDGLAHEEQRKSEPGTSLAGADVSVILLGSSEPIANGTKPSALEAEAETSQPEPAPASDPLYFANIGEGPIPQAGAPPPESEPAPAAIPIHVPVDGAPAEIPVPVPAPAVEGHVAPAPEETAATQVPEAEPTTPAPSAPAPPVEAEATAQDPSIETVASGTEETRTFEEPSALIPTDASAGPAAIIVEDSPTTEPAPAVDGTAPKFQALPADTDEAPASAYAVEGSTLLKGSSLVAMGLIIEDDDAQPTALPEEPANIEATAPESGTEPIPVVQTDSSPSPAIHAAPAGLTVAEDSPAASTEGMESAGGNIPQEVPVVLATGPVPAAEPEVTDESAPAAEEPSPPVPEESTSVSEEPAFPVVAEILGETPPTTPPAAEEPDSTPEEAPAPALAAAETPVETPVPAAEEPAPDAEAVHPPAETPAPTTEDPAPAPEQSVPALPETLASDEPVSDAAAASFQTLADIPAPLAEEPALTAETAAETLASAAEEVTLGPVPDEPVPVPEDVTAATSQTPAETLTPLPEEPATTETAEIRAPDAEGPTQEPAVSVAEDTTVATENHPSGLEGTVEEVPPEPEQTMQEPPPPSGETTAIVVQEPASVPDSEISTVSETEAPVDT